MDNDGQNVKDILDKHKPIQETEGKAFQTDPYGNFRIIIDRKESEWVTYSGVATLKVDNKFYFGVSKYFQGTFPTECVLKVEKYDEFLEKKEKNKGFVMVKITDIATNENLDGIEIKQILDVILFKNEFIFSVKDIE